jgi:4-amino-4-deoxy-L-arabinose transferase-like glycosyltransferase
MLPTINNRNSVKTILFILFITAAGYFWITTRSTLWDRDESRYATVAYQMTRDGNYLLPTLNGEVWLDKPILFYWLTSLSIKMFGKTEFAVRFWPVIGSLITCILTFRIADKITNRKTAIFSLVIMACSLMSIIVSTMALTDGVTIPFVAGGLAIFLYSCNSKPRLWSTAAMGICIGGALLAKGPLGIIPPVIMIITAVLARKNIKKPGIQVLSILLAVLIGGAIFACWAIPADIASGGQLVKTFFGKHILQRMIAPMESHGGNWLLYLPYYLPIIVVGFFPAILLLPGGLFLLCKRADITRFHRIFLLTWIITIFGAFSVVSTKLPHYIWLIWPALAVIAAMAVDENKQKLTFTGLKFFIFGKILFRIAVLLIAAGLIFLARSVTIKNLYPQVLACAAVLLGSSLFFEILDRKGKTEMALKVFLTGWAGFIVLIFGVLMPAINETKISPRIAYIVKQTINKNAPIAAFDYEEPSLEFYLERKFKYLISEQESAEWLTQEKAVLITTAQTWESIDKTYAPKGVQKLTSQKGFNWAKGKNIELVVIGKM